MLSLNKASESYGIPKSTLSTKVRSTVPIETKMGPATVFTDVEEMRIEKWILNSANLGFPLNMEAVKASVRNFLLEVERPNPFKNNLPGRKWVELFLKRHPQITNKNTEVLSKARASITKERIIEWFSALKIYLEKENAIEILNDPARIFNLDETGVNLCPKTGKVLGQKGQRNFYAVACGADILIHH